MAVKQQLGVFAEPRGVVVHQRDGIAKGLEQRANLQDALLQLRAAAAGLAQVHQLRHNVLGRFRLAGAGFAAIGY